MIESIITVGGQEFTSVDGRFTEVSRGIGIDSKNRIWTSTSLTNPGSFSVKLNPTDLFIK